MDSAYPPPHYLVDDRSQLLALMKQQPLATFIVADADTPHATPLPLILSDDERRLLGHMDANNPAAALLIDGREALAIFHGPSAYISPTVYHTRQLPTYNYQQVHVRGTLERLTDPAQVRADLYELTRRMEPAGAWSLSPDDPRVAALLPHIVGFRLLITAMVGRFKESQDKGELDRAAAGGCLRRVASGG